ncbi:MAG: DUF2293 domain-containing protein [Pseudomonadota bacterium]
MRATTPRQKAIHKALRELIPLAPYADFAPIAEAARSKHMRSLAPRDGAFLATVAYIRHVHTDYDELRDDGYDHDSARFFVADAIDEKLREWGSPRGLENPEDLPEPPDFSPDEDESD